MDHLRSLGTSISISIPPDENRFRGRECPQAECEGYFKSRVEGRRVSGRDRWLIRCFRNRAAVRFP